MRTVVHLSDIHIGRLSPDVAGPLGATIRNLGADLVAVSGDLTQRARVWQFREARAFIDALQRPVLVVPGNHDVPLWNVAARFLTPLRRYSRHVTSDLAPVHQDDEMIVFGVNTARSLTWGEGRINRQQIDAIVRRLSGLPSSLIRIIVTHHPFDLPPGVRHTRLVGRAHMAMTRLAAVDADLFLSGHLHVSHIGQSAERYRIAGHSALIVQAGTVSTRGRGERPSFNVLRLNRPRIAVQRMVWDPARRWFVEAASGLYEHGPDGWATVRSGQVAPDPPCETLA